MRSLIRWLVLAAFAACTPPRGDGPAPSPLPPAAEVPVPRDRSNDGVSVQFHVVDEVMRTPPLTDLQANIVILNHASTPRWVLLPRQAGRRPGDGGVDVLEVERWGTVTVGSWLGTGGFRSLWVAGDARVELKRATVQWWRHDDEPRPELEAWVARELLVDGKPAAAWFDGGLAPSPSAIVDGGAVTAVVRLRPDSAEVAVELRGGEDAHLVPWPRD